MNENIIARAIRIQSGEYLNMLSLKAFLLVIIKRTKRIKMVKIAHKRTDSLSVVLALKLKYRAIRKPKQARAKLRNLNRLIYIFFLFLTFFTFYHIHGNKAIKKKNLARCARFLVSEYIFELCTIIMTRINCNFLVKLTNGA